MTEKECGQLLPGDLVVYNERCPVREWRGRTMVVRGLHRFGNSTDRLPAGPYVDPPPGDSGHPGPGGWDEAYMFDLVQKRDLLDEVRLLLEG